MADKGDEAEDVQKTAVGVLARLVPESYYDLIGRVTPGMLGLMAFCYLRTRAAHWNASILIEFLKSNAMAGVALLVGALLLAYALGVLVSWPAKLVFLRIESQQWRQIAKEHYEILDKWAKTQGFGWASNTCWLTRVTIEQRDQFNTTLHDYLKRKNSTASSMLPKLAAEVWLCANSCVLFLLAAIAGCLWRVAIPTYTNWSWDCGIMLTVSILAFKATAHRTGRQQRRQYSFLREVLAKETAQTSN